MITSFKVPEILRTAEPAATKNKIGFSFATKPGMRNSRFFIFAIFLIVADFYSASAKAELSLGVVTGEVSATEQPSGATGVIASFKLTRMVSVLSGVIATDMGEQKTPLPYYLSPLTAEFTVLEHFPFGIGGYYGLLEGSTARKLNYRSADYGLAAHAGVRIPLKSMFVSGDVFYLQGLENISIVAGEVVRNQGVLFLIGAGLHI